MLLEECAAGGVETAFGEAASVEHRDGYFHVSFGQSEAQAPALVLASGGLSIPKLGATSFAYDVARRFGHKIVEPRPALVPLTLPARPGPVQIIVRRFRQRGRERGQGEISRSGAVHSSRLVGPRNPAGIILLAARGAGGGRLPARPSGLAGFVRQSATIRAQRFVGRSGDHYPTALPRRLATSWRWQGSWPTFRTGRLKPPNDAWQTGISFRTEARASPRPRSPSAASAPPNFHRKRCSRSASRGFLRSAKRLTLPAGSAAIISNGPGPAPMPLPRQSQQAAARRRRPRPIAAGFGRDDGPAAKQPLAIIEDRRLARARRHIRARRSSAVRHPSYPPPAAPASGPWPRPGSGPRPAS